MEYNDLEEALRKINITPSVDIPDASKESIRQAVNIYIASRKGYTSSSISKALNIPKHQVTSAVRQVANAIKLVEELNGRR